MVRVMRFARGWKEGGAGLLEEEVEILRSDGPVPANLVRPARARRRLPGWVITHGITRPGRGHPTLLRFVRALARSGAVALVPEIPEWRELRLAPEAAQDTLRAAVRSLATRNGVDPDRVGAIGFSFGVPRVLEAAADPALKGSLRAIAGFGAYGDLERAIRFLFTGRHEWRGSSFQGEPDPYGRWILGANLLTRIPGYEEAEDVAQALLALAREAGDAQVGSWEAVFDASKAVLEKGIHPSRRALFRVFAPPAGALPPAGSGEALAKALATAALQDPALFDARHHLPAITLPVHLIHGREDRLIPFTESLRLRSFFPPEAQVSVSITGLFAHSQRNGGRAGWAEAAERIRFLRMLRRILTLL